MRSTIRNRAVVWGVALAIGLGAISPAIVAADEAPTEAPAGGEDPIALFEAGTKAFKEGRLEEAYTNLHRSFELKASFDTAANLSFVESSLGKTRDAATHLAYALKVFPATGDDSLRERMKADLAKLEVDMPHRD